VGCSCTAYDDKSCRRNLYLGQTLQSSVCSKTTKEENRMWALLITGIVSCQAAIIVDEGNSTVNETDLSLGGGIVGLFDTITGLTKEVGGLFGQFEDGFEKLKPVNDTKVEESIMSSNETEECDSPGSSIIVGLFKTLKDLTKDVGKLVSGVEEELTNRRQDVVDLAERVEDEVRKSVHPYQSILL